MTIAANIPPLGTRNEKLIADFLRNGLVFDEAQTFAGAKTFSSSPIFSAGMSLVGAVTGIKLDTVTVTNEATYDLLITDRFVSCTLSGDDTPAAVTSFTLPTAQAVAGRRIFISDGGGAAGTYNITIDTEGSETVDAGATVLIDADNGYIELLCDGTNWVSIGKLIA